MSSDVGVCLLTFKGQCILSFNASHSVKVLIFEILKYRFSVDGVPKSEGYFVIGVSKSVLFIHSAEYSFLITKEP